MWRTAERRFVGHARNPFLPFLLGIPNIHSLPEAWGSWEPQYTPPALHYCIMPIALLRLQKKPVWCREAEGLVTELWSPRFVTMQWLCSQLIKNCRDSAFSLRGLEAGLAAFRLPMFATCDDMFVQGIHSLLPFGIPSIHSLPEASGSGERQHAPPALHYCIMPIPLLQLKKKDLSHAEKQRVWSRSCGLQELLQCSDCALSWAMWLQTKLLASLGWKRGCQPFSCRCSQHVTTCLSKEAIPIIPFEIPSMQSLPEAFGSWERQHAPPAALLHHAHPFVAAGQKHLSHAEKQQLWRLSF